MERVAVYARVSTDHEDQKNSVENQELYFKDYINKEEKWELYKMYADEGISGTSLKKETNLIDKIVVHDKHNIDIFFRGYTNIFYLNNQNSILSGNHLLLRLLFY